MAFYRPGRLRSDNRRAPVRHGRRRRAFGLGAEGLPLDAHGVTNLDGGTRELPQPNLRSEQADPACRRRGLRCRGHGGGTRRYVAGAGVPGPLGAELRSTLAISFVVGIAMSPPLRFL